MEDTSAAPQPPTGPDAGAVGLAPTPAARAVAATKVFGHGDTAVVALDDVSVDIPTGRFTAIMGPSGSGKSTLMHCMAGLDSLTSGQVFVGEQDLGRLSEDQLTLLRRDRIGFVFQAFNLVPTLTAIENITLPMTLAGRKPDKDWLDLVIKTTGLADRLGHRPSELSGGQQQRVAVGRALASRPQIIFADEPTGNLDSPRAPRSSTSCGAPSARWTRPSSWSPTIRWRPRTPRWRCSSATAASSTRWSTPPPSGCSTA